MSTALLATLGLGAPGIGLLLARWLAGDDADAAMRRHREALTVLAELTGRPPTGASR